MTELSPLLLAIDWPGNGASVEGWPDEPFDFLTTPAISATVGQAPARPSSSRRYSASTSTSMLGMAVE
jgi:hypothetical protein